MWPHLPSRSLDFHDDGNFHDDDIAGNSTFGIGRGKMADPGQQVMPLDGAQAPAYAFSMIDDEATRSDHVI